MRLVSFAAMKQPAYLALNPFGQIPTYEEGDLALGVLEQRMQDLQRVVRRELSQTDFVEDDLNILIGGLLSLFCCHFKVF